jgi:hypothetical protein
MKLPHVSSTLKYERSPDEVPEDWDETLVSLIAFVAKCGVILLLCLGAESSLLLQCFPKNGVNKYNGEPANSGFCADKSVRATLNQNLVSSFWTGLNCSNLGR